jgi:hypothetical protein
VRFRTGIHVSKELSGQMGISGGQVREPVFIWPGHMSPPRWLCDSGGRSLFYLLHRKLMA